MTDTYDPVEHIRASQPANDALLAHWKSHPDYDPTDPLHTPTDEPPHICTYTTDAQGVRSCQVCRRIEDKGERPFQEDK